MCYTDYSSIEQAEKQKANINKIRSFSLPQASPPPSWWFFYKNSSFKRPTQHQQAPNTAGKK